MAGKKDFSFIRAQLKKNGNKAKADFSKGYLVTKGRIYGVSTPVMRRIGKEASEEKSAEEIISLAKKLLSSEYFEEITIGLFILREHESELMEMGGFYWNLLEDFIPRVDNWAVSDYSCQLRNAVLVKNPKQISELKKWVSSDNPWKRRASLITLIKWGKGCRVSCKKKDALFLIGHLISDRDYYVQKAVGWVLRDLSGEYPDEIFQYIRKNNEKLSSIMRSTAMEKLKKKGYSLKS
jgi:3-methyladenine DNA glycosylase AlkD